MKSGNESTDAYPDRCDHGHLSAPLLLLPFLLSITPCSCFNQITKVRAISEQPALLTNLSALSLLSREDRIGVCYHLHFITIEAVRRLLGVHQCPAHLALFFRPFFMTSFCHRLILSSSGPLQFM